MVRIRQILCPVDFFPASRRAADYAIGLARHYGAELRLLHVVSPVIFTGEFYRLRVADLIGSLEKHAARQMSALENRAESAGVGVQTDIRNGDARHEIESAIRALKPGLLVMGTHGRQGFEKWLLGSVTEGMLRRSPVPILVIPSTGKGRAIPSNLRRILVTTDFSAGTAAALGYALSLDGNAQTRITLMHVLDEVRALTSAAYRKELAKKTGADLAKLIPAGARERCDIRIEAGTPYHVILKVLKKDKFDLLVMNTHGKGMLDRALLGSTSEKIVRGATCPVMFVPPAKKKRG